MSTPLRDPTGIAVFLLAACLLTAGCIAPPGTSDAEQRTGTATTGPDGQTTVAPADSGANGSVEQNTPGGSGKRPGERVTETGPGAGENAIQIRNGSLPLDPATTFRRIEGTLETDVRRPNRIRAFRNRTRFLEFTGVNTSADRSSGRDLTPFQRRLGFRSGPVDAAERFSRVQSGYVSSFGSVVVYFAPNVTRDEIRMVLGHEFVHYVQLQNDRHSQVARKTDRTTDGTFAFESVIEGGAVYATDAYLRAFAENGTRNTPLYRGIIEDAPPGHVTHLDELAYLAGSRYAGTRIDGPSELADLYGRPPLTSEQVLHDYSPAAEPPVPLRVRTTTGANWRQVGRDRMGEAFLRVALSAGVSPDRARSAASGWGNDSLHVYEGDPAEPTGYVWVHRWDDAANATVFQDVARDYLGARGNRTREAWTLPVGEATVRRPAERTTVVVFGPAAFRDELDVDAEEGRVDVRVKAGE
jgi:hypothetical protein